MDEIVRISSGAPWEPVFGYSRAVRAGDWVMVSGTTGTDQSGQLVGKGQIYVQARQAIENIAAALEQLGLGLDSVVRTRVFVTELDRFSDLARAHMEMFGEARPASTVVQVTRLVHPDMLVEIEADAYAGSIPTPALAGKPGIASKAHAARKRTKPAPARGRRKSAARGR